MINILKIIPITISSLVMFSPVLTEEIVTVNYMHLKEDEAKEYIYCSLTFTANVHKFVTAFEITCSGDGFNIKVDEMHGEINPGTSYHLEGKILIDNIIGPCKFFALGMCEDKEKIFIPCLTHSLFYSPTITSEKKINVKEIDNNRIITNGYFIENYDNGQYVRYKDEFTFLNLEDNRILEVFKYFDVSFLRFKYRNGINDEFVGSGYFEFYDAYNLFPSFPIKEGSMIRQIPLKINKDNDIYYFSFLNKLYYAPNSHYASYTFSSGYIETDYLYFPREHAKELKNINCSLNLKINGLSKFSISNSFSLSYILKDFGDCSDSEYCVKTSDDIAREYNEKIIHIDL